MIRSLMLLLLLGGAASAAEPVAWRFTEKPEARDTGGKWVFDDLPVPPKPPEPTPPPPAPPRPRPRPRPQPTPVIRYRVVPVQPVPILYPPPMRIVPTYRACPPTG